MWKAFKCVHASLSQGLVRTTARSWTTRTWTSSRLTRWWTTPCLRSSTTRFSSGPASTWPSPPSLLILRSLPVLEDEQNHHNIILRCRPRMVQSSTWSLSAPQGDSCWRRSTRWRRRARPARGRWSSRRSRWRIHPSTTSYFTPSCRRWLLSCWSRAWPWFGPPRVPATCSSPLLTRWTTSPMLKTRKSSWSKRRQKVDHGCLPDPVVRPLPVRQGENLRSVCRPSGKTCSFDWEKMPAP